MKLLEYVKKYSHLGYRTKCGDEILRTFFPYISIVSADYEEQYVFITGYSR